jgi:signal transduction histidine kinase
MRRPANRQPANARTPLATVRAIGRQIQHADGHGFGLAIVQAVVRAHGAGIWPHPRPEGGLDVVVSFADGST